MLSEAEYLMFERGYQAVSTTIDSVMKDLDWAYFSIVLYEENPIYWEERILTPEHFLISLADKLRNSEIPTILILNAARDSTHSVLKIPQYYRALLSTIGLDKLAFTFSGGLTELKAKIKYPEVKIGLNDILDFETMADALINTAPIPRKLDKEMFNEISELMGLSYFLIDYLKPPTLTEEVMQELERTSKYEIASHVISSLSAVLNPTSMISKGLSYALKFMEIVQKRQSETYQAFLDNWQMNVENAFNPYSLSELIGESSVPQIKDILHKENLVIIFTDIFENIQSIFLPSLVKTLLAEEEEVVLLMDSITRIDRFKGFQDWLAGVVDSEVIKLASIVPTYGIFSEWFDDFFSKLIQDRVLYFDVNSRFLSKIFENRPVAEESWVIKHFREIQRLLEKKQIAFISFNSKNDFPWEFVKPTLAARVVHGIKWKFRRFKRRFRGIKELKEEKEEIEEEKESEESSSKESLESFDNSS